jgi:hypothetical protein
MSTNYTGNQNAPESPSPQPAPGSVPILNIPTDGDALAAASVTQGFKTLGDHVAYVQKTALLKPPQTPNTITGFTAVTHVGSGPALGVAPVAVSTTQTQPTNAKVNVLVRIVLGGVTGVATFQWSNDGGVGFTIAIASAATYTDPTSGITVAFTGTQVANDTYAFTTADTPIAQFTDGAGNARTVIDHCGYLAGRRSEFREDWPFFTTTSATGVVTGTKWNFTNTNCQVSSQFPLPTYPGNYIQFNNFTAAGNKGTLYSGYLFDSSCTYTSLVFEFEFAMGSNVTNTRYKLGIGNGTDGTTETIYAWFQSSSAGNWICGTSGTLLSTSTAPATGQSAPTQRFRIEFHGSATPFGACTRFFINELLVAANTATLPTNILRPQFSVENTGVVGGNALSYLGSVYATWNRWSTPGGL